MFLILFTFLNSCSNSNEDNLFESNGIITGLDLRLCVCGCGGYFIEIDSTTYRFNEEFLPENNLDLSVENLPLKVKLNWELEDCGLITISSIQ